MSDVRDLFSPLNDRVLIRIDIEPEKTKGGLWIPEQARQKSEHGWVEAVAEGIEIVKIGDKILFDKYAGTVLKLEGVDYIVIPTDSILGIMK